VQGALEEHEAIDRPTLEEILLADTWARETVLKQIEGVRK
jgi:hypothetical protein